MDPTTTTTTSSSDPGPADARAGSVDRADGVERTAKTWRPAEIHRVRNLSVRDRRIFFAVVGLLALLPVLSAVVVLGQGWRASGDNALISLRVHDVLTGHLPVVGQPSTGENFGSGVESSHPGPIEFYLIAPLTLIVGPTIGLALGAALINSAGLVGIAWLAFRRGNLQLLLVASVVAALLARSLGGNFLHDPVSSNVGAIAALALLFAAWSVLAGDLRTLPVFVIAGTFALQDHLSYLGTLSPVILVAIILGTWWIRHTYRHAVDSSWLKPRLIVSGLLAGILWLPVVLDQLFGSHNLTAIIQTFTAGKAAEPGTGPKGFSFAVQRLSEALAPWPIFSRRVAPLGWLHTPATHEVWLGYLVLFAVIGFGVYFWRRRRTDLAAMALVVAVASAAGFYTAMKLPAGAGVKASNLRWMWTVSAFTWIALAWMIWQVLPALWKEIVGVPVLVFASAIIVFALAGVVSSIGLATDRDGTIAAGTTDLVGRIEKELPKGRYRVTYAGGSVVLSIGPAVVHDLDYRGDELFLDIGPFTRAYGRTRTWNDQQVDGTLVISAEAVASYGDDTELLGRQTFRVNRNDKDLQTVRVFLKKGEP